MMNDKFLAMRLKNAQKEQQEHPALGRVDMIFSAMIALLIPVLVASIWFFYDEYQKSSNPAHWKKTTATVLKVESHRLPKSRGQRLVLQLKVPGKAIFEDSFEPLTKDFADLYQKDLEQTRKVDVYKSVGPNPEYTLSYTRLAFQRWMPCLLLVGGFGGLTFYGLLRWWGVSREAIRSAVVVKRQFPVSKRFGGMSNWNQERIEKVERARDEAELLNLASSSKDAKPVDQRSKVL